MHQIGVFSRFIVNGQKQKRQRNELRLLVRQLTFPEDFSSKINKAIQQNGNVKQDEKDS